MLTKDLLRYRNLSGYARPMFIAPDDRSLLELSGRMLEIYRNSIDVPRSDLQDALQSVVNSHRDLKLSRGLLKLLDDRCKYSGSFDGEYPENRKRLFLAANAHLTACAADLPAADFRTEVFRLAGENLTHMYGNIYADLPDYERLLEVPDWTPEILLERYNIALAQSLVLYATSLTVTLEEADGPRMRRCFKYLKFFRLLADVSKSGSWHDSIPSSVQLKIDGPASILDGGSKYGLQLASFLPAVFQLTHWKVSCELNLSGKKMKLNLTDSAHLNPRFGHFGIYVPEEVRMFAKLFQERCPEWILSSDCPFLKGKGQQFIFPDMLFTRGETSISLELFHKWHMRQLPERLDFLSEHGKDNLLIGVDRSILTTNPGLKRRVEEHALFGRRIFLFRNFPETGKVAKLLSGFSDGLLNLKN